MTSISSAITGSGSSATAATEPQAAKPKQTRPHLYEIDLTRAVTVLSVIGVHVAAYTLVLAVTPLGQQLQNAAIDALHFTREIFLAITAFVLTYSYANRPFSAKAFWRKRGVAVLLPYALWSLFYEIFTQPALPPLQWLWRFFTDLISGQASFQLYYILLTLEFYILLPWFLQFINWASKRPWLLLGGAFALQLVMLILDYALPQSKTGLATGLGLFIDTHQDRFLPIYEFYIVCGALAAIYMNQVRAWLLRHGGLVVLGVIVSLALLLANFYIQFDIAHQAATYASSVYQPAMAFYGVAVSAFIYWIGLRWATRRAPAPPRGARFWMLISDISFGIYLMHAYFVDLAVQHIIPNLPRSWPLPLGAVLVYLFVAVCTISLCTLFLSTPGLSRLIGRSSALPRDKGLGRWIDLRLAGVRTRAQSILAPLGGRRAAASPAPASAPTSAEAPALPADVPPRRALQPSSAEFRAAGPQ